MTRIYTRTAWVNPWHLAFLAGSGIAVDQLVRDLRADGIHVAVVQEPSQLVRKPEH